MPDPLHTSHDQVMRHLVTRPSDHLDTSGTNELPVDNRAEEFLDRSELPGLLVGELLHETLVALEVRLPYRDYAALAFVGRRFDSVESRRGGRKPVGDLLL